MELSSNSCQGLSFMLDLFDASTFDCLLCSSLGLGSKRRIEAEAPVTLNIDSLGLL